MAGKSRAMLEASARDLVHSGYVRRALENDSDIGVTRADIIMEWLLDGMGI